MKQISTPFAVLLLFVWGCILAIGVGVYAVAAHPQRLVDLAVQRLHLPENGISLSVGRITPLFWPTPGLALEELLLRTPEGNALHVRSLNLHLDWVRLLTARIVPGTIELDRPSLMLRLPSVSPTSLPVTTAPAPAELPPEARLLKWLNSMHGSLDKLDLLELSGLTLRLRQGQMQVFTADQTATDSDDSGAFLRLHNVEGVARLPGLLNGLLDLQIDELRWSSPPAPLPAPLKLANTHLLVEDVRPHVLETADGGRRYLTGRLDVDTFAALPGLAPQLEWGLQLTLRQHPQRGHAPVLEGRMDVQGDLHMAGQVLPARLAVPFVNDGLTLDIHNAEALLEGDRATFNGKGHLPATAAPWALEGQVRVEHLSLSRWFGFARDLPVGLRHALNTLTGTLDVRLTPTGLEVPQISASLPGMTFSGKGGVPNFAAPAIQLDLSTPQADANLLFPALLTQDPPPPAFAGPVLVASDPKAPHSVGFDIRLRADQARFWKWDARLLSVGITPYGRGAQVAIRSPAVYGGSLALSLGFEDSDVAIQAQMDSVNLEQPVTRMTGYPALGGSLAVKAALRSDSDSLDALLAGLRGQIQSQIVNGFITTAPGASGKRLPFSQLGITFSGQGATLPPGGRLGAEQIYSGDWRVAVVSPEVKGEATLKGPLRFSTADWLPVEARQIPANAAFTALRADVSGTGTFSFHRRKSTLAVEQFVGTLLGGRTTGSLKGSDLGTTPRWEAQGQCSLPRLRAFLESHGYDLSRLPQDALQSVSLNAQAEWSDTHLRLSPLSGKVDDTVFSGTIQKDGGKTPHWVVHLGLGNINLNTYLPRSTAGVPRPTVYPVEALRTFTLDGSLKLDSLTIAGLRHENLRLPLKVSGGTLRLDPVQATLGAGPVTASFTAEALPSGALTQTRYEASKINLLAITKARKQESLIAGTGYATLNARGLVQTSADIPKAFNGQWKWAAENGYFVESKKEQDRDARRSFTNFFASGVLDAGVLRNDNLHVSGPVLNAKGQGTVNLNTWTLDFRIDAALPGVPNIPIHFYGSLDKPESNVNALKAIGSALENLGRSAFGVIGDILSAPVKLFK